MQDTKGIAGNCCFRKPCAGGRAEQFAPQACGDRLLYKITISGDGKYCATC